MLRSKNKPQNTENLEQKTYPNKQALLNQIFCCKLAEFLEVPCLDYNLTKIKTDKKTVLGTVNKDIKTSPKFQECRSLVPYASNTVVDIMKHLKERGYSFAVDEMELSLFKIALFDYLTCQTSRFDHCFGFLTNGSKIVVAPLYDNEYSFGLTYDNILNIQDPSFYSNNKNYMKALNIPARFSVYNSARDMIITNAEHWNEAMELVKYATSKPVVKDYLVSVLNKNYSNFFNNLNLSEIPREWLEVYKNCIMSKLKFIKQATSTKEHEQHY